MFALARVACEHDVAFVRKHLNVQSSLILRALQTTLSLYVSTHSMLDTHVANLTTMQKLEVVMCMIVRNR